MNASDSSFSLGNGVTWIADDMSVKSLWRRNNKHDLWRFTLQHTILPSSPFLESQFQVENVYFKGPFVVAVILVAVSLADSLHNPDIPYEWVPMLS